MHSAADLEGAGPPASVAGSLDASRRLRRRRRLALSLMVVSGFAALGYQIVWTQQSALWLGHEAAAVLAVVAAFFGGLALGALLLGPRIDRSARPGLWYGACEAAIGLWGLALAFLMAPAADHILDLTGPQPSPLWQWTLAFCGTFLMLLPATAAMGATLPAMERVLAQLRRQGASIGALYAANTFGTVLGVLSTAFWLVPAIGLARTAAVCMAFNLLCAFVAFRLFAERPSEPRVTPRGTAPGLLLLLAATGLLGIGSEMVVVRVLSQVTENTVFTFALLLAVYLIGTALGAAAYQRWLVDTNEWERVQERLLRLVAAACLLGSLTLAGANLLKGFALSTLGPSMAAALAAEATMAVAAFLLPTVAMGALFSHLGTRAQASAVGFGRALGVNTLGAAFAPPLFGVLLVPVLGTRLVLMLIAILYLALSLPRTRSGWAAPGLWITAAATVALTIWAPSLRFVDVAERGRVVSYREGVMAAVSVVEDPHGLATLHIDNRQPEGSNATLFADARQAVLPLLLHPAPRRALFLGLGTGVTAASAAEDPMLQVHAVELLPEVIEASEYFRRELDDGRPSPRLRLIAADARRYVRTAPVHYDLIVSDNFHPARSGSGSLYTVEHFEAMRDRLAPAGLFCQWLPLHQLDLETLRSIVRTFMTVYPHAWAMLATNSLDTPVVGLIARRDGERFDVDQVRDRLGGLEMPHGPAELGIGDELALLGSFVAGPSSLAVFAGNSPLNTDDRPVVAYLAPHVTYAPDSLPRDRLIALLHEVEIRPEQLVKTPLDPRWEARLAAYWKARDRFIEAGRDVQPTPEVRKMLAQVREPLLSVLRISSDFRPAYDPLLRMARALGQIDPAASRELLAEIHAIGATAKEARESFQNAPMASP